MRVLVVTQHFPPEPIGNATRLGHMTRHLARLGHRVTVVTPRPTFPFGAAPAMAPEKTENLQGGIEVVRARTLRPRQTDPSALIRLAYYLAFALAATLWALRNRDRFDAIISTSPPLFTCLPGIVASTLLRKQFIYDVRDLWIDASAALGFVEEGGLGVRVSRRLEAMALNRANIVCCTTEEVLRRLNEAYGFEDDKVILLPNGVELDQFGESEPPSHPRLIFLGNVGHAQDLETVVDAVEVLRGSVPSVRLLIVGDGDRAATLREYVASRGMQQAVEFVGTVPPSEARALLAGCTVGLAPVRGTESLGYMVPIKTYEYMAAGIPFVGFGSEEMGRLAERSGGGMVVAPDPEAVAGAISLLTSDPGTGQRMGRAGRAYVQAHHDWGSLARRLNNRLELNRTRRIDAGSGPKPKRSS